MGFLDGILGGKTLGKENVNHPEAAKTLTELEAMESQINKYFFEEREKYKNRCLVLFDPFFNSAQRSGNEKLANEFRQCLSAYIDSIEITDTNSSIQSLKVTIHFTSDAASLHRISNFMDQIFDLDRANNQITSSRSGSIKPIYSDTISNPEIKIITEIGISSRYINCAFV